MYEVPKPLVNLNNLPPPLMTSEPDSFAYNTFKVRVPHIVDDIVTFNDFPPDVLNAISALRQEITSGTIRALEEEAPDVAFWDKVSTHWLEHSWLEVPWYWAEAYFYRRVLEATHYFQPGEWCYVDPYQRQKNAELTPNAAPELLGNLLNLDAGDQRQRFEVLLYASLWGNRTDLSYNVATSLGPTQDYSDERVNLLVDDTALIWDKLSSRSYRKVAIITDNAGTELCMDLALVDFLLNEQMVQRVDLHLKPQPFYISDAMSKDVISTIQVLINGTPHLKALGRRLREYVSQQRLLLTSHWMYTSSLFFFQLPGDLYTELGTYDLVVLKGDANYRRLLGDAHWPPTTSFAEATAYFPAPLVALRTLKAELITGLAPGLAEQLTQHDAAWLVNGKRGVVQSNLRI